MTVCRYFLNGNCRYGQNCRFEHVYDDPSFRAGGGGGGHSRNQYSQYNYNPAPQQRYSNLNYVTPHRGLFITYYGWYVQTVLNCLLYASATQIAQLAMEDNREEGRSTLDKLPWNSLPRKRRSKWIAYTSNDYKNICIPNCHLTISSPPFSLT